MSWYSTDTLSKAEANEIAGELDRFGKLYGVKVTKPVTEFDEATGQRVPTGERRDAHVWHCSLSLAPDHEPLGDDRWGQIAREFVEAMGFDGPSADGAVCQWAAVHHGETKNGGDHIHLVVNLVTSDGTVADVRNDYRRASAACAAIEERHGLEVVDGRHQGRSARPETYTETEAAGVGQMTYTARLAMTVRAVAAASSNEAEFVRMAREEGLWVRPRFAAGGQEHVTGYAVADRPAHGQTAVWRSGGKLGRDLSLSRLRMAWGEGSRPEDALDEWRAAWRGQPLPGQRRGAQLDDETLRQMWGDLARVNEQLAKVDPENGPVWSHVAGQAAGVLGAWSLRTENRPGELARASDALARSAQTQRRTVKGTPSKLTGYRSAARVAMALGAGMDSRTAQVIILRQLVHTLRTMSQARSQVTRGRVERRENERIADALKRVQAQLPAAPPSLGVGKPPAKHLPLDPALPRTVQQTSTTTKETAAERGIER
ncbi:relaxase/mobilization nuclease domain-containing protein [Aeromicrobium camelliae]|nr:relaxase/mobilization nuclease domain-containing protein [Aeromicrobium camelliae]